MLRSRYTESTIAVKDQLQSHHIKQLHPSQQHKHNQHQHQTTNKQTIGTIKVYAPEVLHSLTQQHNQQQQHQQHNEEEKQYLHNSSLISSLNDAGSPYRSSKRAGHGRTASMIDLLRHEVESTHLTNTRLVHEAVDRNDRINQQRIQQDYETIQQGNTSFIADGRTYLSLIEQGEIDHRHAHYIKWSQQVFEPIQQQVNQHIDTNHQQMKRFKRALFEHYHDEHHIKQPIKPPTFAYTTSHVDEADPTFTTLRLQRSPHSITSSTSIPVSDHVNRPTFTATMWSKLDSTPYGRYNLDPPLLSPSHLEQIERGVRIRMAEMGFDHYEEPVEQISEAKGKRIVRTMKSTSHNIINNHE